MRFNICFQVNFLLLKEEINSINLSSIIKVIHAFLKIKKNKLKTEISNNTLETKIDLQPSSSKGEWSSRRPPGYGFNKEINKETATFVGHIFLRIQVESKETKRKRKGIERKIK